MNPQPPEYVGNVFGLLFVFICMYYFIKSMLSNDKVDYDNFIIGYVEDNESPHTTYIVNNTIKQVSQKKSLSCNKLMMDCIDTLCALGMKKTEAKQKTLMIFNTPNPPNSIQEFLLIALKK